MLRTDSYLFVELNRIALTVTAVHTPPLSLMGAGAGVGAGAGHGCPAPIKGGKQVSSTVLIKLIIYVYYTLLTKQKKL